MNLRLTPTISELCSDLSSNSSINQPLLPLQNPYVRQRALVAGEGHVQLAHLVPDVGHAGNHDAPSGTPAVVVLVMVVGPDAQVGRLLDAGKNLVAEHGMLLDPGEFLVGQPAVLVDDGVRHADLAHVVQQRGKIHLLARVLVLARLPGDPGGVHGHPGGMAVGILVFGVDGVGEGLGRLFKQGMLLLLGLPVGFDLHPAGVPHLPRHVPQGKYVDQRGHGDDGHVVQRDAVHEHLEYGRDDGPSRKDQQRKVHVPAQVFAILQYDGHLYQQHRKRHHIADDEPRRPLVAVHIIKGIVEARELGDDHQRHAHQRQRLGHLQPARRRFQPALVGIQVDQVQVEAVDDRQRQKEDQEIADAHHPPAQRTGIAPEDIGPSVGDQQDHGADLQLHQYALPLLRHGVRHIDEQRDDAADADEDQHDVSLVLSDYFHD